MVPLCGTGLLCLDLLRLLLVGRSSFYPSFSSHSLTYWFKRPSWISLSIWVFRVQHASVECPMVRWKSHQFALLLPKTFPSEGGGKCNNLVWHISLGIWALFSFRGVKCLLSGRFGASVVVGVLPPFPEPFSRPPSVVPLHVYISVWPRHLSEIAHHYAPVSVSGAPPSALTSSRMKSCQINSSFLPTLRSNTVGDPFWGDPDWYVRSSSRSVVNKISITMMMKAYEEEKLKKDKPITFLHFGLANHIFTKIMDLKTPKQFDKNNEKAKE
ncbi:hypothetical protein CR513_08847, partial [Mucuna pruriens]